MGDLILGFKYVFQGFSLIIRPGVRLYVLVPLLINTLLFAVAIVYGANQLQEFIESYLTGWLEWLRWLIWPLFIIVALTVLFFCFSIIANLIAAPFNGFLSEAVENHITGKKKTGDSGLAQLPAEIWKAMKSESVKFLYFTIRAIPLLLLFIIPGLNLAAPFLWILFGAWMLALEYIDFPMGNHGITFSQQRDTIRNRRQLAFGFGLGTLVLTLVPVINFVAIPVAVSGVTKMWVEQLRSE